jgi:ribosomal protein S18 acetylase RimI-like enzyme
MNAILAQQDGLYSDPTLAALGEYIEARAWQDIVAAAPAWLRELTGVSATQRDGMLLLAGARLHHLLFNRVIGLGEHTPATDEQVATLIDHYWTLGIDRYWVHVGPYALPTRMGRLLHNHGLKPYRRSWVKLMRPAKPMRPGQTDVHVRAACREDGPVVASIAGPAFDLPQIAAEFYGALIERPRWQVFVAEIAGEIAGAAGLYIEGEVAYLAFAATRPELRRRGAQRALLSARINAASEAGCRWIAAETGFPLAADETNPSYQNLLWAGFRPVAIRDNYVPVRAVRPTGRLSH